MTTIRDLQVKKTDKFYKVFDRVIIDQHQDRVVLSFFKGGKLIGTQETLNVNLSLGDVLNLRDQSGELLFTVKGDDAEG